MKEDRYKDFWHIRRDWYRICVERAHNDHEFNSPGYLFWWSLRYEFHNEVSIAKWYSDPDTAMREWLEYYSYKLDTARK
jgi:hypothetical protein